MTKTTDISIDIETLDTKFSAAVLAIGAAAFNRKTGEIGPTYYAEIDIDEALKFGSVSGATLAWWMNQDASAKKVIRREGSKLLPYEALRGLSDFIRASHAPCVWGNGATFDITILEHMYLHVGNGLSPWWTYQKIRDMRTIVDVAGVDPYKEVKFEGTAHNAKDDAVHQARLIALCFKRIAAAFAAAEKAGKTGKPIEPKVTGTTTDDDEL